jgi:serine/threonine protein kinase/tetratricopeptide (TPR) repeat protein
MIGETVSHYKIVEKLGEGGMGVVYKALDTTLERHVAIKFLPSRLQSDKKAKKRFAQEAKAASALNNSNIAVIHEIDETPEGHMFIVMAYYDGRTLKDKLEDGPLPVDEAVKIVSQIASGLAAAHEKNIFHRDIKPANILITQGGEIKLADFGLAKLAGQTKLTKTGTTVGTVSYMSPEQAGGREVDARSDIFSLGVVLYELLTGELPFPGDHEAAVLYGIMHNQPEPLTDYPGDVPELLQQIVNRMLAKDPASRYQSAGDLLVDLMRVLGRAAPSWATRPKKNLLRVVVPSSAVFLAVILLLVFKPFKVEITPDQAAKAAKNLLAVMYFENVVEADDPQRLGEIATNLLITDLSESEYVRVLSSQRIYDILKRKGKEGTRKVDRDTATEVAREAGAKWMLVGSILRTEPHIEMTSQLIDVASGESPATQRLRGAEGEDIFPLVDRLSTEVRNDLGLPEAARGEADVAVADVTTRSVEAYRFYLEGREHMNRFQHPAARASFEKAVEADSTFALAWIELTHPELVLWTGITDAEQERALTKAKAHSERLSRKERRYIDARTKQFLNDRSGAIAEWEALIRDFPDEKQAYYELGVLHDRPDTSITHLRKAIEIDPLFTPAYNSLAEHYQLVGDFEKSIWAINQSIHIAPDDANAYDTQGDLYGLNGQADKAISSFKKAVEVDPSFGFSWVKLADLYFLGGDEVRAKECWNQALKLTPHDRAVVRYHIAMSRHYRGRVDEAIQVLEQALIANELDGFLGRANSATHWYLGFLWALKGEWERSEEAYRKSETELSAYDWWGQVAVLAVSIMKLARLDVSRVEGDLPKLAELDRDGDYYWLAKCWVDMARGRYDLACEAIEKVGIAGVGHFAVNYTKSIAYLRAGRYHESIEKLEYCRRVWSDQKTINPDWAAQTHYYLGVAYERTGENNKAIEQFEKFVDLWRDADAVYTEQVEDARRHLSLLLR